MELVTSPVLFLFCFSFFKCTSKHEAKHLAESLRDIKGSRQGCAPCPVWTDDDLN